MQIPPKNAANVLVYVLACGFGLVRTHTCVKPQTTAVWPYNTVHTYLYILLNWYISKHNPAVITQRRGNPDPGISLYFPPSDFHRSTIRWIYDWSTRVSPFFFFFVSHTYRASSHVGEICYLRGRHGCAFFPSTIRIIAGLCRGIRSIW